MPCEKFVEKPGSRDLQMSDGEDIGTRGALSPAAARALAEAEARRKERTGQDAEPAKELGREGPDPARYGDWEKGGIVSDF
jgi:hypothetical protein